MMFTDEINSVFRDIIEEGIVKCSKEEYDKRFKKLQSLISGKNTGTRKPTNFLVWLSTDKRNEIKQEYFSDYDEYSDWSENGIRKYYNNKSLPLDKFNKRIADGKSIQKPRLMQLITMKAGLIWADMSSEEKALFNHTKNSDDEELDTFNDIPSNKSNTKKKKKGRPSSYKAKSFVVDSAIEDILEQDIQPDDNVEHVELESFMYHSTEYFKDDNMNVYDSDCNEIGKIDVNGQVKFL